MSKYIILLVLFVSPLTCYATQDRYAEILEASFKGTLLKPFKTFELSIAVNPEHKNVSSINFLIDDKPVNIVVKKPYNVTGVELSTLKLSHSPIHYPNVDTETVVGVGPAYFTIQYRFNSIESCKEGYGEIYIVTRLDTLDYEFEAECQE